MTSTFPPFPPFPSLLYHTSHSTPTSISTTEHLTLPVNSTDQVGTTNLSSCVSLTPPPILA